MAAQRTLIIKLGAAGDVVRTTVLLHALEGEVTWVTAAANVSLLPDHPSLVEVMSVEQAASALPGRRFDLVICLDDEPTAASLVSVVDKGDLVGTYLDAAGQVAYTDSAAGWFDMGLCSRFGKERADELKKANRRTCQDFLYDMIGQPFAGQEYLLRTGELPPRRPGLVGLENRAGDRWPTKKWNGYDALAERLEAAGHQVRFFQQRDTVEGYISDIGECGLLVTGDTLGLHIGLALQMPVVGIFTCTSEAEIFDYGRLRKVVSPRLDEAFYRTEYVASAVEAVTLDAVNRAVRACGFESGPTPPQSNS